MVTVRHKHEWAKGTKVAGLCGRVYSVGPDGFLEGEGGVHPEDVAEFRRFVVFEVRVSTPPVIAKSPPVVVDLPKKKPKKKPEEE